MSEGGLKGKKGSVFRASQLLTQEGGQLISGSMMKRGTLEIGMKLT